jgi:cob(I)alamin adenosyltransferase
MIDYPLENRDLPSPRKSPQRPVIVGYHIAVIIIAMTKFYTSTGDDGFTSLLASGRVPKYHPRPEAVGTLDEASAALGAARAFCQAERSAPLLLATQRDLYHIMAEVSATPNNAARFRVIDHSRVAWLESEIDQITALIESPEEFIVPGDTPAGGLLSLARAIIRRAEREIARLVHMGEVENKELLRYLNRLSSLCFSLELLENQVAGKSKPTLAKNANPADGG